MSSTCLLDMLNIEPETIERLVFDVILTSKNYSPSSILTYELERTVFFSLEKFSLKKKQVLALAAAIENLPLLESLLERKVTFCELPVSRIETGLSCLSDQTQTSEPALVTKCSLSIQQQ